jgi:plastocyanin
MKLDELTTEDPPGRDRIVTRFDLYALSIIVGVSLVLASLLAYATFSKGPGSTAASVSQAQMSPGSAVTASYPTSATVTIPHADRFEPLALEIAAGGTVTWRNHDTDGHTVVGMPTDPVDFKLAVGPGGSTSITFKEAGIYGYYCDAHSTYDRTTGLIKANKGTDAYPVSMYGVILVVDPSLPVASGGDKVVVPGADRFQPLATVVHTGTMVAWTNIDTDPHSVFSPPDVAQQLKLTVQPGGTSDYTFHSTGTYTYYCNLHATWNADLHRVQALPGSSEYPAAMEGVIFVLP